MNLTCSDGFTENISSVLIIHTACTKAKQVSVVNTRDISKLRTQVALSQVKTIRE